MPSQAAAMSALNLGQTSVMLLWDFGSPSLRGNENSMLHPEIRNLSSFCLWFQFLTTQP
eukprot:CAMPEP_0194770162 /NCGR_PEP_ID=MMETSP0323_2-20130528/45398_1 /TAXON_ID=2866 ORGANISM="Crypthecodinium cohnii, Strain Seligo" /NCGR_SAMPLE_ID=MMETSP0323_2 /ASSEMBLY_ACC=CAM_ASM_000346 /LENGTH=58 /DNA_ID=CAMNT_0039703587 /DNA_START=176 /DNA_END=348 /DNA_ORIENTATION=+